MSELKRALTQAADDLANVIEDELTRRDRKPVDLDELAESINLEHLAGNLSLADLAAEFDVGAVAEEVDLHGLAGNIDLADLAQEIDLDDVAASIQVGDLVREIDTDDITTRLAQEIDLGDLSERLVDDLAPHLNDVTKRVLDLQAQMATIGDHLFILAANLRGDNTASWDATAATLGEAADLVPDNRVKDGMRVLEKEFLVDGNGIRIADLEAVEDELTGRACEEGVEFSD